VKTLEKAARDAASAPATAGATPNLEVAAQRAKTVLQKQLKKQLVWKGSCRSGSARWAISTLVAEDVYKYCVGLDAGAKVKGLRMEYSKFVATILEGQEIYGSARYDRLSVTSPQVNVSYKDGEMRISGTYGK
jgi:hypothetical protein